MIWMKSNNFFDSFGFAFQGFKQVIKYERNFRFHLLAALVVIFAGIMSKITLVEWTVIVLCIAGMLSLELERIVDLASPEVHILAKHAKDMSAAAVLVFACASAIIGILIFLPKWMEIFN